MSGSGLSASTEILIFRKNKIQIVSGICTQLNCIFSDHMWFDLASLFTFDFFHGKIKNLKCIFLPCRAATKNRSLAISVDFCFETLKLCVNVDSHRDNITSRKRLWLCLAGTSCPLCYFWILKHLYPTCDRISKDTFYAKCGKPQFLPRLAGFATRVAAVCALAWAQ